MKNILVIGAGKSSSTLIKYLIENSKKELQIGHFYQVKVLRAEDFDLFGEIVL